MTRKRISICCPDLLKAVEAGFFRTGRELGTDEPIILANDSRLEKPIVCCPWCREEPVTGEETDGKRLPVS